MPQQEDTCNTIGHLGDKEMSELCIVAPDFDISWHNACHASSISSRSYFACMLRKDRDVNADNECFTSTDPVGEILCMNDNSDIETIEELLVYLEKKQLELSISRQQSILESLNRNVEDEAI